MLKQINWLTLNVMVALFLITSCGGGGGSGSTAGTTTPTVEDPTKEEPVPVYCTDDNPADLKAMFINKVEIDCETSIVKIPATATEPSEIVIDYILPSEPTNTLGTRQWVDASVDVSFDVVNASLTKVATGFGIRCTSAADTDATIAINQVFHIDFAGSDVCSFELSSGDVTTKYTINLSYGLSSYQDFSNSKIVKERNFVLINDIDMSEAKKGSAIVQSFKGTLDGRNNKIYNLSFDDTQSQAVGLFKSITPALSSSRSTGIKNLTIASTDTTFNTHSGVFAATIAGTEEKPIALTNIKMEAAGTFFCQQDCALLAAKASYVDVADITFTTTSPVFIVRGDAAIYTGYSNYVGFMFANLEDSTVSKVTTDIEFTTVAAMNRATKNFAIFAAKVSRSTLEKMHFSFDVTMGASTQFSAVIASYALDTTMNDINVDSVQNLGPYSYNLPLGFYTQKLYDIGTGQYKSDAITSNTTSLSNFKGKLHVVTLQNNSSTIKDTLIGHMMPGSKLKNVLLTVTGTIKPRETAALKPAIAAINGGIVDGIAIIYDLKEKEADQPLAAGETFDNHLWGTLAYDIGSQSSAGATNITLQNCYVTGRAQYNADNVFTNDRNSTIVGRFLVNNTGDRYRVNNCYNNLKIQIGTAEDKGLPWMYSLNGTGSSAASLATSNVFEVPLSEMTLALSDHRYGAMEFPTEFTPENFGDASSSWTSTYSSVNYKYPMLAFPQGVTTFTEKEWFDAQTTFNSLTQE